MITVVADFIGTGTGYDSVHIEKFPRTSRANRTDSVEITVGFSGVPFFTVNICLVSLVNNGEVAATTVNQTGVVGCWWYELNE